MLKVQAGRVTIRLSRSLVVQTFDQLFVKEDKENPLYASTARTLAVVTNRCKKTCRINRPGNSTNRLCIVLHPWFCSRQ